MIDFDWIHHMSNGWKDGKSIRIIEYLPFSLRFLSCQTQPTSTPICQATRKTTKQRAAGNTCVRLDLGSSWLSWLVQIQGWLYICCINTHRHWKKVISFKKCPTNDFQPSCASISCVLAHHLGNPDSWSEAPANVKKGNSTWETNQHTTHLKFITRHFCLGANFSQPEITFRLCTK